MSPYISHIETERVSLLNAFIGGRNSFIIWLFAAAIVVNQATFVESVSMLWLNLPIEMLSEVRFCFHFRTLIF